MDSEIAAARGHPAVVASIVAAAIAVTLCALVAIAWMLGWVGTKGAPPTPASFASPGQRIAGTAPGVALLPGETLVTEEPAPGPLAPSSTKPAPASAKSPEVAPPFTTLASPPLPATRNTPSTPNYSRAEVAARPRGVCVNCGTVEWIHPSGDGWELRVRYDDGSGEVRRYDDRPRLRRGDRVRLEEGRLLRD